MSLRNITSLYRKIHQTIIVKNRRLRLLQLTRDESSYVGKLHSSTQQKHRKNRRRCVRVYGFCRRTTNNALPVSFFSMIATRLCLCTCRAQYPFQFRLISFLPRADESRNRLLPRKAAPPSFPLRNDVKNTFAYDSLVRIQWRS